MLAVFVSTVAFVTGAQAQSGRDIVAGPLTTARFERLARLYVAPSDDELSALDRLHERYLDRFRTEIEPEINAIADSGNAGFPTKDRFERLLRDIDRVNARIAEADSAFFAAAAEAVAESRRPGIERMKSARERQRLLAGVARFVPMSFGNGASFVDLADLLTRGRYTRAITAEMRPQFDAFLSSQESRLLAQARSLHSAASDGMGRMFDLTETMMRAAEPVIPAGATPEQEAQARAEAGKGARERMREAAARMQEIGAPIRKILRSNHTDNRIAGQQLASILGRTLTDELREIAAARALGGEAYAFGMSMDDNAQLAAVATRMKSDAQVAPEAKERLDALVAEWRGERATALEKYLTAVDEFGASGVLAMVAGSEGDPAAQAARAGLESAREQARTALERTDNRLKDALLAMLGTRVERYFEKIEPEEGEPGEVEYFVRVPEDADGDGVSDDSGDDSGEVAGLQGFEFGYVSPITERDVSAAFKAVGADPSTEIVSGTYDAWRAAKWEAAVEPINQGYREAQEKSYEFQTGGGVKYDAQQIARMAELSRSAAGAVCDADEALAADLAGALGVAADSPAIVLVRLAGLMRLSEAEGDPEFISETDPQTPSVASLLEFARATPDEARAVIAGSKAEWLALATEIRPALLSLASIDGQLNTLQSQMVPGDREAGKRFTERYSALVSERGKSLAAVRAKLLGVFDAAYRKAIEDPDRREAFARARTRAVFPQLYGSEHSAEAALTDAMALRDLNEELRARIEALRAEYLAVFDKLTDQIVEIASTVAASDDEGFAEYNRKMQMADALRFQRDERTSKALGELRRLLGPALAARIPALKPKIDDEQAPSLFSDEEETD